MSHNLEMVGGKASMAYSGEPCWHGLGTPVSNDLTPHEMLVAAGLDWTVSKQPLYMKNGEQLRQTTMTALIRDTDNSILTFVPDNWEPLQNEKAFEFFDEFVRAGELEMNTAGSICKGRRTWALAKTKEKFRLRFGNKEDVIEDYLLFSNPHEFGRAIIVDQTDVRVVCNNTLTLALSKASAKIVKMSHDQKFDPEVVKETLFAAKENLTEYRERAEFLITKKYKKDLVKEYFQKLFPSNSKDEEKREKGSRNAIKALEFMETQPGAELGEGTYWQLFNTITYMSDHQLGRTQENRLNNVWYGTTRDLKIRALNLALEMAETA